MIEALGLFDFLIVKINSYDEMFTVDGVSGTMEQHEWNGRLTKQTPPSIAYPLKFSFNEMRYMKPIRHQRRVTSKDIST